MRRLLLGGAGSSVIVPPPPPPPPLPNNYAMLFNGSAGSTIYDIGLATSTDAGVTWTPYAGNPVISHTAGWTSTIVHAPALTWDGTQWVTYNDGKGSNYAIGRWTSPDLITWTPYGSNPVLTKGASGAFDDDGVIGPTVLYEPADTGHQWKMWYTGSQSGGTIRLGYADSTDGITWTKRGQMLAESGSGFDSTGIGGAPAYNAGGTYYLYFTGWDGTNYRTGYATCTDPATAGTYTKHGVIAAFAGTITLSDSHTYRSNQLRPIVKRGSSYIGLGTCFDPTADGPREVSWYSTSTDLVSWTPPAGPLIALGSGWDSISAENPSIVETS